MKSSLDWDSGPTFLFSFSLLFLPCFGSSGPTYRQSSRINPSLRRRCNGRVGGVEMERGAGRVGAGSVPVGCMCTFCKTGVERDGEIQTQRSLAQHKRRSFRHEHHASRSPCQGQVRQRMRNCLRRDGFHWESCPNVRSGIQNEPAIGRPSGI